MTENIAEIPVASSVPSFACGGASRTRASSYSGPSALHPRQQFFKRLRQCGEYFTRAWSPCANACGGVSCTCAWCPSANACGGVHRARSCRVRFASTSGGVLRARSCRVRFASTNGGVLRARSCRVRFASTNGGVLRARSSRVRCASTSGGVHRARSSRVPAPAPSVSTSRLLLLCTRHKRQVWCLLHPRQFCPHRQRQVSIFHLRQLCFVLEVFKALSQDRVPLLVVDVIFLSLLGGYALRMRLAVCTFACVHAPHAMGTSSVG